LVPAQVVLVATLLYVRVKLRKQKKWVAQLRYLLVRAPLAATWSSVVVKVRLVQAAPSSCLVGIVTWSIAATYCWRLRTAIRARVQSLWAVVPLLLEIRVLWHFAQGHLWVAQEVTSTLVLVPVAVDKAGTCPSRQEIQWLRLLRVERSV
jgi:hypothetical protein